MPLSLSMRAAASLVLTLGACTPAVTPLQPGHPARADATPGRLAGPPAALRDGGSTPPASTEPAAPAEHSHHEHHR